MGRIQSSIGLITGTDIAGTVDQLIALSARPRDRLLSRTDLLQQEQGAIAELTAAVIGVQLAGNKLTLASTFRSKSAESSNSDALSVTAGTSATVGSHLIRTLQTAATHSVGSLQRFSAADQALGFTGTLRINPDGGFLDESASLSGLNGGRGVEAGVIRITDRSGTTSDIDLTEAQTVDDVIAAINDATVSVKATTVGDAIQLIDQTGSTISNLKVEQLGSAETAADLGLWGIDSASNTVTGNSLELPAGVTALRGVALTELNGGTGVGPLTNLDITLSDGSTASVDLSSATTTTEVIDLIEGAGLSLIVGLNEARNGLRLRDVSGGTGTFSISSADNTAADLGIVASTTDDIVVGENLNRQSVTTDTLLSDLNQGNGPTSGSFTITDSADAVGAINLAVDGITTVGELINSINNLGIGVTASINDAGDGIAIVDTAAGTSTLTITDTGSGTAAQQLGIEGTATNQTVHGTPASALVGSQAGIVSVDATDTLSTLVDKINQDGRYATASVIANADGTFSLNLRSNKGGADGQIAINTTGFDLDLRTNTIGQDALIGVSTDGGPERFLNSSDGVFKIDEGAGSLLTDSTLLSDIPGVVTRGSFTVTDSAGNRSAVNLTVENITTVGELINAIDNLGIGVDAKINDAGDGIAIVDTASGAGKLKIEDAGNGTAASSLGIEGTATTQLVGGVSVSALVGPSASGPSDDPGGLVLTLKELSDSPIRVTVNEDAEAAVSAAETFVEQYNLLVEKLDSLTFFNADTDEVGLLFGSNEALRIRNGYSRLLSGRISGAGELRTLGQVGLQLNDKGKLELDRGKLESALASDATSVEDFFASDETGLAERLNELADRLAGEGNSLLISRTNTISSQIESNNERIENMNDRLERERERLLLRFYRTEEAISKIQSSQSAIAQIQPITIPSGS